MNYLDNWCPDWLATAVSNDTLKWENSIKTTFPTFFDSVTLHDSIWLSLMLNAYNETILIIKLDAFWNKEYTLRMENTGKWPFLIIKIAQVVTISFNATEHKMVISTTESKSIESIEIKKLVDHLPASELLPKDFLRQLMACKQVHKTSFFNLPDVLIEILHDAPIEVLLLEEDGKYLDASLEKVKPFMSIQENKPESKNWVRNIWDKLKSK